MSKTLSCFIYSRNIVHSFLEISQIVINIKNQNNYENKNEYCILKFNIRSFKFINKNNNKNDLKVLVLDLEAFFFYLDLTQEWLLLVNI